MFTLFAHYFCPPVALRLADEPPAEAVLDAPNLSDVQKEEILVSAERELMELQQLIGVMHKKGFKDEKEFRELVDLYAQLSRSIGDAIRTNNLAATIHTGTTQSGTGGAQIAKRSLAGLKEDLPRFTSVLGPAGGRGKVSQGPEVNNLQRVLNWEKISVNIDGIYTPDTMTAVKHLQKKYGLPVNGIVGSETRKLLNVLIGKG